MTAKKPSAKPSALPTTTAPGRGLASLSTTLLCSALLLAVTGSFSVCLAADAPTLAVSHLDPDDSVGSQYGTDYLVWSGTSDAHFEVFQLNPSTGVGAWVDKFDEPAAIVHQDLIVPLGRGVTTLYKVFSYDKTGNYNNSNAASTVENLMDPSFVDGPTPGNRYWKAATVPSSKAHSLIVGTQGLPGEAELGGRNGVTDTLTAQVEFTNPENGYTFVSGQISAEFDLEQITQEITTKAINDTLWLTLKDRTTGASLYSVSLTNNLSGSYFHHVVLQQGNSPIPYANLKGHNVYFEFKGITNGSRPTTWHITNMNLSTDIQYAP
jgi:hypothetical protein